MTGGACGCGGGDGGAGRHLRGIRIRRIYTEAGSISWPISGRERKRESGIVFMV